MNIKKFIIISCEYDKKGNQSWKKNNMLHGIGDLPAFISIRGSKIWYKNGLLHRSNNKFGIPQPAIIHENGDLEWYQYGMLHRSDNLPSIIYINKKYHLNFQWYQYGLLHRDDDFYGKSQPAIILCSKCCYIYKSLDNKYDSCYKSILFVYYKNGLKHRNNDLPAVIKCHNLKKAEYWYQYGKLHRNNYFRGKLLPAVIKLNGKKKYYKNGVKIYNLSI